MMVETIQIVALVALTSLWAVVIVAALVAEAVSYFRWWRK